MKLVLPSYKYKMFYERGVNDAIKYGDVEKMEYAYQEGETFSHMLVRLDNRRQQKNAPSSIYWILNDNKILVGTIDLRHNYKDTLGNISYYIFPKYRNRGYASEALKLALDKYKKNNINKVMVSCLSDNLYSQKIIEKNGGILQEEKNNIRKYWIDIK